MDVFSGSEGDRLNATNVAVLITAHNPRDGLVLESIEAEAREMIRLGIKVIVIGKTDLFIYLFILGGQSHLTITQRGNMG